MITWKGIEIANRGFLINLKDRQDRLSESLEELSRIDINGVEVFDAVKIDNDSEFGWRIRGCTQSHIDILKHQVRYQIDKVIIFEDDFFLDVATNYEFVITHDVINKINCVDFDVMFLGTCLMEKVQETFGNFLKPNKFVQTTCYISTLKFAEFVVHNFDYLDPRSCVYGEAIDTYYYILATKDHHKPLQNDTKFGVPILKNDLKIYVHYPILFSQRPSYSDITRSYVDYRYANKTRNIMYYPN